MKTEIIVLIVVSLFLLFFLISLRIIKKIQAGIHRLEEGIKILERYFKK